MVLRGLVLWCPLPPSRYCCFLSFERWSRGYGPTGSGTVAAPPFLLILLYSLVLTGEGMVLRGLQLLCLLPPSRYCCILLWFLVYVSILR